MHGHNFQVERLFYIWKLLLNLVFLNQVKLILSLHGHIPKDQADRQLISQDRRPYIPQPKVQILSSIHVQVMVLPILHNLQDQDFDLLNGIAQGNDEHGHLLVPIYVV